MVDRIFQFGLCMGRVQFDRSMLFGQVFGMLERQVQEDTNLFVERQIVPGLDRLFRQAESQSVGREHMAGAAKTVSRKLVEQDHQRQRAFGMV